MAFKCVTEKNPRKGLFQYWESLPLDQTIADTVADVECDWNGNRVAN
jgi:hypothetical protein